MVVTGGIGVFDQVCLWQLKYAGWVRKDSLPAAREVSFRLRWRVDPVAFYLNGSRQVLGSLSKIPEWTDRYWSPLECSAGAGRSQTSGEEASLFALDLNSSTTPAPCRSPSVATDGLHPM